MLFMAAGTLPVARANKFSKTSDEINETQFPYIPQKVSEEKVIQQLRNLNLKSLCKS
jgi:hypothetical protein